MRVTLDLDRLLREQSISVEERDRLLRLARRDTGNLLGTVLGGFGVIAVAGAAVLLVPNAATGCVLGVLLGAAGIGLRWLREPRWELLASFCILVAALTLGAGIVLLSQGISTVDGPVGTPWLGLPAAFGLVTALFAGGAVLGRSALLAALAVLALSGASGTAVDYEHASYGLLVRLPLQTVAVFSAVALGAYLAARRLPGSRGNDWERLLIVAARTALLLVNAGFWVGSLWGGEGWNDEGPVRGTARLLAPWAFGLAWALALLAVAVWAARNNRRWVLNLAAVFGGIHFYTQWFERLGAEPVTVLAAGLLTLAGVAVLRTLNRRMEPDEPVPGGGDATASGGSTR